MNRRQILTVLLLPALVPALTACGSRRDLQPAPGAALPVAANFTRHDPGAPLAKPDAELLKLITDGVPGKPMPPFGGVLKVEEIRDVLAYLRAAFGTSPSAPSPP